jgi:myo-inositol-1-phosphate synthase
VFVFLDGRTHYRRSVQDLGYTDWITKVEAKVLIMARSHPLIEARQIEYEFEKIFRGLEQRQKEPEYVMDIEFFKKFDALREKYGYTLVEVADLLMGRYSGYNDTICSDVSSVNTKALRQLLELCVDMGEGAIATESREHDEVDCVGQGQS